MGYWEDESVQKRIGDWMRTAVGITESSHVRVMRVADNMRNVAVTEGDKVEAQIKFGWEVDAYPVNEIVESVNAVSQADIDTLVEEYYDKYDILLEGRDEKEFRRHVAVQAGIEIGFERFLEEKNYQAIVTHFGDLGGLKQLPGLAMQRLMEKGYGFGAEGDWKTAAMVRLMKIMTAGIRDAKGTSFMEDYLLNTRDQYYMEGGMRVYNLKEVVVTGSRKKASSESIYTGGINTYTIEGDRLEGFGAQTAFDAVSRLPGVSVTNGNEIHIRNNPEQPVIVIDDVVYEDDNDILTMIQTSDMSSLSLLRGADAAILGSRGSAGAIVITLKDGKAMWNYVHTGLENATEYVVSDKSQGGVEDGLLEGDTVIVTGNLNLAHETEVTISGE